MDYTKTPAEERRAAVYVRYWETLWRLWNARHTHRNAIGYAQVDNWDGWHRIDARGRREYDRAEHGTHGPLFRPLWCAYCQKRAAG